MEWGFANQETIELPNRGETKPTTVSAIGFHFIAIILTRVILILLRLSRGYPTANCQFITIRVVDTGYKNFYH